MTPSQKTDELIASLNDWRGPILARLREIFHEVDPELIEEWKWKGSPVWEHDGILAVGLPFKTCVKLGFMYGASLPDPDNLFNDELNGNQRRAIKYFEGDTINEESLKILIRAAITFNQIRKSRKK